MTPTKEEDEDTVSEWQERKQAIQQEAVRDYLETSGVVARIRTLEAVVRFVLLVLVPMAALVGGLVGYLATN